MWFQYTLVGLGGLIGSILRFTASVICKDLFTTTNWPIATFSVNLIGCFIIGLLFPLLHSPESKSESLRLFLMVGVLGGFTTFSSFGLETLQLWQSGHTSTAAGYVLCSVLLGLACVAVGMTLSGGRP